MSLTTATRVGGRRRARSAPVTSCIHPLEYGVPIHRARSMPSASQAERAPVQEDVLAGVRAQALPEQHDPGPRAAGARGAAEMRSHSSRFCSRAPSILPSDSGEGRLEYCSVTVATSPRVRYCAAATAT